MSDGELALLAKDEDKRLEGLQQDITTSLSCYSSCMKLFGFIALAFAGFDFWWQTTEKGKGQKELDNLLLLSTAAESLGFVTCLFAAFSIASFSQIYYRFFKFLAILSSFGLILTIVLIGIKINAGNLEFDTMSYVYLSGIGNGVVLLILWSLVYKRIREKVRRYRFAIVEREDKTTLEYLSIQNPPVEDLKTLKIEEHEIENEFYSVEEEFHSMRHAIVMQA